ncbi:MAG: RHS repeat-associated core domain-containing protein [Bacteroidota bacterium]|nr:RHS repeat-associated core domain-containing protein [Bacteroidota bacterium]
MNNSIITHNKIFSNDYYPGGMTMPGRAYSQTTNGYRYGFNGKEKDNEVVQYDYGFRIYDPRLVRFKSIDPLAKAYPELTPYQFASNSPIMGIDLDGREIENFIFGMKKKIMGVSSLQMNNVNSVIGEVQQQYYNINIGNPTKTVQNLQHEIATNINSIYGTGAGSFNFEKQQTKGQISKGDYINIDPGWKGLDIAVKVADVQNFKNNKVGVDGPHEGFAITFRTLEGHVEVGSITFTALQITNPQTGIKSLQFSISSTSQLDNGIATTVANGFSRAAQQRVWQQVLKNVLNYTGGEVNSAYQRIDKYKNSDFVPVNNDEKTIGYPKTDATPETKTKDLEIKPDKK